VSVDLRHLMLITVAEHYQRSGAIMGLVELPGRSHLLLAGEGRAEVAQFIPDGLDRVLRPAPVAIDEQGM
jgi:hypothetical protein